MSTSSRSTDIFDLLADVMVARQAPWREHAACSGMGAGDEQNMRDGKYEHLFFPKEALGGDEAKSICATCPVKAECEADHYAQPSASRHHGVWFGTSALDRELARKGEISLTAA